MAVQENTSAQGASDDEETAAQAWFGAAESTFGDRLEGARTAAGLSHGELARRLGVKVSTVRHWEEDTSEPRANKLQMLSGLLNVSLTWLLTAEGDGLDGPVDDPPVGDDLRSILTEMRQLKMEMSRASERVGVLEKRLRKVLKDV